MTTRPRFQQGKFVPDPTLLSFNPNIDLSLVNDDSIYDKYLDTGRIDSESINLIEKYELHYQGSPEYEEAINQQSERPLLI